MFQFKKKNNKKTTIVPLIISLAIGAYYALTGSRQKTTDEYFLGNR